MNEIEIKRTVGRDSSIVFLVFSFGYEIRVELSSDACRHRTSHATDAPTKSIPVAFASRVFDLVAACRLDHVRQRRTETPIHRIPNVVSQASSRVWTRSGGTIPGIPRNQRVIRPVLETFAIFQGIREIFIRSSQQPRRTAYEAEAKYTIQHLLYIVYESILEKTYFTGE